MERQIKIYAIQMYNKDVNLPQALDLLDQFNSDIEQIRAFIGKKGKAENGRNKTNKRTNQRKNEM